MTIYGSILPGAASIARSTFMADKLTERAKYKLKILSWRKVHQNNNSLTARHFGIGRMTLHRWLKRFERLGILGLNECSKKPKNVRRPTTPWSVIARVIKLRRQYPAWSKHKLAAILKREGLTVSASTAGRI
jgi:transposase